MKFRKKPIVIEAFRWMHHKAPQWWEDANGITINVQTGSVFIPTLKGSFEAKPGDWIIQGVQGEIYPCKPDIFDATYEPVEEVEKLAK